jgi:hypothetical protein
MKTHWKGRTSFAEWADVLGVDTDHVAVVRSGTADGVDLVIYQVDTDSADAILARMNRGPATYGELQIVDQRPLPGIFDGAVDEQLQRLRQIMELEA